MVTLDELQRRRDEWPRVAKCLRDFRGALHHSEIGLSPQELDQMCEAGLILRVGQGRYTAIQETRRARGR